MPENSIAPDTTPAEVSADLAEALARAITPERYARLVALQARLRRNPDYEGFLERGHAGIAEYRQQIQEEWERDQLAEKSG